MLASWARGAGPGYLEDVGVGAALVGLTVLRVLQEHTVHVRAGILEEAVGAVEDDKSNLTVAEHAQLVGLLHQPKLPFGKCHLDPGPTGEQGKTRIWSGVGEGKEPNSFLNTPHDSVPLHRLFFLAVPLTCQPDKLLLMLQNQAQVTSPLGRFPRPPRRSPHTLSELPQFCASLWSSPLSWVCLCQLPSVL